MDLSVKIGKSKFKNPVTVASGTFGYGEKYYDLNEVKKLGALVPKTITLKAREGNPPPRIHETASGMINAIGIENSGVDDFVQNKLPRLKKTGVPLIISITGKTDEEFIRLARKLESRGIRALELNLSCPNLQKKVLIAQDAKATARVVRKVKNATCLPVIAKLSPNVRDITRIALAAQKAGADAVSLVNTFAAMAIDVNERKPVLGNITGGLSGPAIKPIALYMVWKVAQAVKIPIIAMGGIMTAEDALEFMIAGATMISVGTANFIDPRAPLDILEGIKTYMRKNKMKSMKQVIGSVKS